MICQEHEHLLSQKQLLIWLMWLTVSGNLVDYSQMEAESNTWGRKASESEVIETRLD